MAAVWTRKNREGPLHADIFFFFSARRTGKPSYSCCGNREATDAGTALAGCEKEGPGR